MTVPTTSLASLDDALAGGSARSAFTKASPVGSTVTGTIIDATVMQARDYMSGDPKTWNDGRPQLQIQVRIQTGLREQADDDGIRGIYIKTWGPQRAALQEAIRALGLTSASQALVPGATFTAQFTGTRPAKQGDPEKLYAYQVSNIPPQGLDAALVTPVQQTVPQPAPVAQVPADPWASVPAQVAPAVPVAAPAPVPVAPAPVSAPAPVPVAPAPVAAPASAPVPTAATVNPLATPDTIRGLASLGMTADQIAAHLTIDPTVVTAVLTTPPAA